MKKIILLLIIVLGSYFGYQQYELQKERDYNIAIAKEYIENNASNYKLSNSGLYYKIIKEGNNKKANLENNIKVNYEGKLIDGTIFDSSYERGEPETFPLNVLIEGWQEGISLIGEGGSVELMVSPKLGYGHDRAFNIPASSTLLFKIELIEIME